MKNATKFEGLCYTAACELEILYCIFILTSTCSNPSVFFSAVDLEWVICILPDQAQI